MKISDIPNTRPFDRIAHPKEHELALQAVSCMKFSRTGFTSFHFSGHLYNVQLEHAAGAWFLRINGNDFNVAFDTRYQAIKALVHSMVSDHIARFAEPSTAAPAAAADRNASKQITSWEMVGAARKPDGRAIPGATILICANGARKYYSEETSLPVAFERADTEGFDTTIVRAQTDEWVTTGRVPIDYTPRYAPNVIMMSDGRRHQVLQYVAHPPNTHPKSAIKPEYTALELKTAAGSRWYGVERAWINSELRMCVSGFSARFEEMAAWQKARRA